MQRHAPPASGPGLASPAPADAPEPPPRTPAADRGFGWLLSIWLPLAFALAAVSIRAEPGRRTKRQRNAGPRAAKTAARRIVTRAPDGSTPMRASATPPREPSPRRRAPNRAADTGGRVADHPSCRASRGAEKLSWQRHKIALFRPDRPKMVCGVTKPVFDLAYLNAFRD